MESAWPALGAAVSEHKEMPAFQYSRSWPFANVPRGSRPIRSL